MEDVSMGTQYVHLDLDERRQVARWRDAKMSVAEIALRLGRAPSTIYREIRRNFFRDAELPKLNGYYGLNAQAMAERRR
jgi:IS30 family transposase